MITWKDGKDLTIKKVTKKQNAGKRGRGGRGGKGGKPTTITVEEPCVSFFNFFDPEKTLALYEANEEMEDVTFFFFFHLRETIF